MSKVKGLFVASFAVALLCLNIYYTRATDIEGIVVTTEEALREAVDQNVAVIIIDGEISLTEEGVEINNGRNITVKGSGTIIVTDAFSHFEIRKGAVLTLEGEVTLTSESGSLGGGVHIHPQGIFNMYDGIITANERNGVYVGVATFNMYGGQIIDNHRPNWRSRAGGGGVEMFAGTFNMHGGLIAYNSAESSSGGIYALESTINIYNGEIRDNFIRDERDLHWASSEIYLRESFLIIYDVTLVTSEPIYHSSSVLVGTNSHFLMNGGHIDGTIQTSLDTTISIISGEVEHVHINTLRDEGVFIGEEATINEITQREPDNFFNNNHNNQPNPLTQLSNWMLTWPYTTISLVGIVVSFKLGRMLLFFTQNRTIIAERVSKFQPEVYSHE